MITHMVYFEETVLWLVYFRIYSSLRAPLLSHLRDRLQSQQDAVCMLTPVQGAFEDIFENLVLRHVKNQLNSCKKCRGHVLCTPLVHCVHKKEEWAVPKLEKKQFVVGHK